MNKRIFEHGLCAIIGCDRSVLSGIEEGVVLPDPWLERLAEDEYPVLMSLPLPPVPAIFAEIAEIERRMVEACGMHKGA